MEIGERFLPIGTIVLLKNGKKELMIINHCVMPEGEGYDKTGKIDVSNKVFDYGACLYPEGMITSNQMFAFNHSQIERVCFKGYQTEAHDKLSQILNDSRETIEHMQEERAKEGSKKDE